jgi:hypothetical protein
MRRVAQIPKENGHDGIAYGADHPLFWIDRFHPHSVKNHTAFVAATTAQVDAFYKAGLTTGGRDNGPPGIRTGEGYRPGYYAAFLFDPDGNNVEALCRQAASQPSIDDAMRTKF